MASIKEAFDSTMKEAFSGIKLMLWAIPITMGLTSFYMGGMLGKVVCGILLCVASFLFYGLCITAAHNTIVKNDTILPAFDFVKMSLNAAMALIAVLPYAIISWILGYGLGLLFEYCKNFLTSTDFYSVHPIMTYIFVITIFQVLYFIIVAIPITAIILFIRRLNILEAFNLKKYFFALGETFISYTLFTFKFAILALIVFGFIFYLFYLFIGFQNSFWIYLLTLLTLIYQILLFNALAQISDDIFTFPEKEEQKRKEDAKIQKMIDHHQ